MFLGKVDSTSAKAASSPVLDRWAGPVRVAALTVPAVVALELSVHRSVNSPMWRDEYATAAHAVLDVPDLLDAVGRVDAVFGPYYLLMHALVPVLGDDVWLRLPSVVAFVMSTVLVGVIGLRWLGGIARVRSRDALRCE